MFKDKARDSLAYILGFKPVRTTGQRILVVCAHILLWSLFLAFPLLIYRIRILDVAFIYREMVNKAFLIILFYLNYYYFLPKLFQRGKIARYFLAVSGCLVFLTGVHITMEYYLRKTRPEWYAGRFVGRAFAAGNDTAAGQVVAGVGKGALSASRYIPPPVLIPDQEATSGARRVYRVRLDARDSLSGVIYAGPPGPFPPGGPFRDQRTFFGFLSMVLINTLSSGVVILLLGGFIKLAHSFWLSEKQKKVLETEKLHAELNFLKLQINPHFLFNTLNSIYSQAHLKSEQTEHSILKFSQIMRYVLYDSTAEKIPLSTDIEYIRNYIDLQKLRIARNVTIQFQVAGITDELLIPPLLLITFIENAFKHGISYTLPSAITIDISVVGADLFLTVGNTIVKNTDESQEKSAGGVGLTNARRRLDVLYPGQYELDISVNNRIYVVNLKIVLNHETELHHH